jgi:hypothetical protein
LSALAVDPARGAPIAALNLELESSQGVITSRHEALAPLGTTHPEALMTQVAFVETLGLCATCVHVVDREADAVVNFRAFAAAQHLCVIRGNDNHYVEYQGACVSVSTLPPLLDFTSSRPVLYHGNAAHQYVAEAAVVITRPYIRRREGKREVIAGPAVTWRLVISEVRSHSGLVLARWYLYTNVPETVPTATIAGWYYFRWRIEGYHKLLKSAGWQLEDWQQESAWAIAKRLAVVSMATALIWLIQYSPAPEAEPLRRELMRLSGRQIKKRHPVTAPALLAGLWTLLSAVDMLDRYTPDELQALARQAQQAMGRL